MKLALANGNQAQSGRLNLKMVKSVTKIIPAQGAIKPRIVLVIIEEDPHATHDIIKIVTSVNHFIINEIIHNALKKRKVASRWIPHELTNQTRKNRVEACKENFAIFRNGPWRLIDIIFGNESWFYLRIPLFI